jgi:hypothetical protein
MVPIANKQQPANPKTRIANPPQSFFPKTLQA